MTTVEVKGETSGFNRAYINICNTGHFLLLNIDKHQDELITLRVTKWVKSFEYHRLMTLSKVKLIEDCHSSDRCDVTTSRP